jgi:hypothetical protein
MSKQKVVTAVCIDGEWGRASGIGTKKRKCVHILAPKGTVESF